MRWYYREQQAGAWEVGAPTSHVRDLTGREPEDFATIARRYAQRPDTQRTGANLARTLWDLARIVALPPSRLDHVARLQQQPEPAAPRLSSDSPTWKEMHLAGAGVVDVIGQPRASAAPRTRPTRVANGEPVPD